MTKIRKRIAVHEKTKGHCWYCGKKLSIDELCVDHALPQSLGGTNDLDNLLPSCRSCNCSKRNKTIDQYRGWLQWRRINVEPFSDSQIVYLRSLGIELEPPPPVTFWGEEL